MGKLEYMNKEGEWIAIDSNNADTVDGKHADGLLKTTEQLNIVKAINELLNKLENETYDLEMMIHMGGLV